MRKVAGLTGLLMLSIAAWMGLERWTEAIDWPAWPTVARNTLSLAQVTTVAIASALLPQRRMVGAVAMIGFYGMCFAAQSAAGTKHSFSAWETMEMVAAEATFGVAIFVIVQGIRLFLGWRIDAEGGRSSIPRGQFRLSELTEWMVSWGLLLGLNHASGSVPIASASRAAQFFVYLWFLVLMGTPIAWLLLRSKLNAGSWAWSILVTACVIPLWMLAEGSYVSLTTILQMWRQHVWAGFLLWCFLSMHLLGIRWLGYRLEGRSATSPIGN